MLYKNILKKLILCMVFATSIGIASAEAPPNIPMGLYGDVNIGSSSAPVGTKIEGKVGTQLVAYTNVVNAGKYGDINNFLGIYAPSEGTNVDIYVNGVKVTTVAYVSGKSTKIDLNAPAPSNGNTGSSSGSSGGSGGGGVSGGRVTSVATPAVTAIKQESSQKESIPVTPAQGTTTAATPVEKPEFEFSSILGVFGVLAILAILIFGLKKMGKI